MIVYPDEFLVPYEEEDEAGVVHSGRDLRSGEAWERGPLVISLRDVHARPEWEGYNVVIHECAHKLDMRTGALVEPVRLPQSRAPPQDDLFS